MAEKDLKQMYRTRTEGHFPDAIELLGRTYAKVEDLRYGTNPHQPAAFYRPADGKVKLRILVDEASVEPLIRGQGYGVRYVPDAIVYNKGPETVDDFLRQRRRIYAGHLEMQAALGYSVSTMSGGKIAGLLLRHLDWRLRQLWWTARVVALEVYGRYLGRQDYKAHRSHTIWEIAETTKELESL